LETKIIPVIGLQKPVYWVAKTPSQETCFSNIISRQSKTKLQSTFRGKKSALPGRFNTQMKGLKFWKFPSHISRIWDISV